MLHSPLSTLHYIDTHCHLDGEEFHDDLEAVIQRAQEAGCEKIFVPAIDLKSSQASIDLAHRYPGFIYPMIGLHPEEVRADWREQLESIRSLLPLLSEGVGEAPLARLASTSIGLGSLSRSSWEPSRNRCAGL